MDAQIRPITLDEFDEFAASATIAFGGAPDPDETARERTVFEPDRSLAAFDGASIVSTFGAFTFTMAVPGIRDLPTAGTTWVTVLPTHRRRGLLTAMMQRHLADVHERGEPLAALWASESVIYGRFGFGSAAPVMRAEISRNGAFSSTPPPTTGTIRLVDRGEAAPVIAPVYEHVRATRPGLMSRTEDWWTHSVLSDLSSQRGGASEKLVAVHDRHDGPDGYCIYRVRSHWDQGLPEGTVEVTELVAQTPAAARDLWRYCVETDLCTRVVSRNHPPDDPLPFLLRDPRKARCRVHDGLWVRTIDVAAALAGRGYSSTGELVLQVADPVCPWNDGRWRLEASQDGAACTPTDREPDVVLPVAALGAVYLGGTSVGQLAAAGLIEAETDGALARLDRLLRVPLAPWPIEVF